MINTKFTITAHFKNRLKERFGIDTDCIWDIIREGTMYRQTDDLIQCPYIKVKNKLIKTKDDYICNDEWNMCCVVGDDNSLVTVWPISMKII